MDCPTVACNVEFILTLRDRGVETSQCSAGIQNELASRWVFEHLTKVVFLGTHDDQQQWMQRRWIWTMFARELMRRTQELHEHQEVGIKVTTTTAEISGCLRTMMLVWKASPASCNPVVERKQRLERKDLDISASRLNIGDVQKELDLKLKNHGFLAVRLQTC